MKHFQQLVAAVQTVRVSAADAPISSIEYDSRQVKLGTLFVAMKGGTSDGNRYIEQAMHNGAAALVTDTELYYTSTHQDRPHLPIALVDHGRHALAELCRVFYDQPDERLGLTGVTGTNGKTTTAYLVEQLLRATHRKTMLVGTIEYRIGERVIASPHTTPESRDLLALFAEGLDEGVSEAVMEVSSHALDQGRVWQLAFDTAIFTNLTQDHLDYHGTLDAYLRAKQRLFDGTCSQAPKYAVINADDEAGVKFMEAAMQAGSQIFSYGIHEGEFRASGIRMSAAGTHFSMHTPFGITPITTRLVGRINVYNLLAAGAAALSRGLTLDDISSAAENLQAPPGRFQTIDGGQDFAVIVDYAHTPDALRNVTALARELVHEHRGRVITVFGCGGDRDRTKRPLMGQAAGEGSDFVVVTSDNPRSEDPDAIIADILPGMQNMVANLRIEPDRARAIQLAIEEARTGDLVLIAGKGHEKTQTIGAEMLPFDDAEQARNMLAMLVQKGVQ
jgi:UDP-N-acetylmuramoyl-L-alanyl-D-glutamate--2,6-diaminopimelate ligase